MITIRNIAKIANLSVGTVSNVLNGVETVKEENRAKVMRIIKKYGYHPNRVAQSLARRATKNIGFIIPDIKNPFFSELVRGSQDYFDEKGYYVFLCNSDGEIDKEEYLINDLVSMWIAGIIIVPNCSKERRIEIFKELKVPFVIVDREIEGLKSDTVIVNNKKGSYEMVKLLIGKGHKKIVALMGPKDVRTSMKRYDGWKKAMIENGLQDENLCIWGEFSIDSGYEMAGQIINKIGDLDAIFAGNDLIGIGVIQYLKDNGIDVPGKISVAGFDDLYVSKIIRPCLTTVRQPAYKIGKIAAELLFERVNNPVDIKSRRIVVDGELVIRDSVKEKS